MHYKKLLYTLLFLIVSPVFCIPGLTHKSYFENLINEAYNAQQSLPTHDALKPSILNQAIANLYVQNPHLLQEQHTASEPENTPQKQSLFSKIIQNRKKILYTLTHWGMLYFFCYNLYTIYDETYLQQNITANQTIFQQALSYIAPSIFVSVPTHISFFLQGTELIIQTYLMKQLLKMVIFCFV